MKNKKVKEIFKWIFESFIWLGVLLLIIDFVTKQIVLHNMTVGQSITLIPGFLSIEYVVNYGMAFGINFNSQLANRIIFVSVSLIGAIILISVFAKKVNKLPKIAKAAIMLMTAGCIGNLIDRAFYSAEYLNYTTNGVVDWIAFDFGNYQFYRFNVADSCLVIGTIILIIYLIIDESKTSKKEKQEKPKENTEKILSLDEKKRLEETKNLNDTSSDSETK
ncbi:MAG: signal peptidase II [Bacilli bacterium]